MTYHVLIEDVVEITNLSTTFICSALQVTETEVSPLA